jgi:hypothetical protein
VLTQWGATLVKKIREREREREKVAAEYPDCVFVAFLDDVTVLGPPALISDDRVSTVDVLCGNGCG